MFEEISKLKLTQIENAIDFNELILPVLDPTEPFPDKTLSKSEEKDKEYICSNENEAFVYNMINFCSSLAQYSQNWAKFVFLKTQNENEEAQAAEILTGMNFTPFKRPQIQEDIPTKRPKKK